MRCFDGRSGWTTLLSHGQDARLGTWHHVGGVFDQREIPIDVDGRLAGITIFDFEAVTAVGASNSTWAIGARAEPTVPTRSSRALLREGRVTNYIFLRNLREAELAQQTVSPATSCNGSCNRRRNADRKPL